LPFPALEKTVPTGFVDIYMQLCALISRLLYKATMAFAINGFSCSKE